MADPILEALAAARKTLRLSQVQMARLAGTSQSAISEMERGGNPTLKTLRRLFDLLGHDLTATRRPFLTWEELEAIEAASGVAFVDLVESGGQD